MQLLVKGFDACTHVVQAEGDAATLWDVKQKLQGLTGVPAEQQHLQCGGRLLRDDGQALAAAGLQDGALLQLTLPLRGGAPVKVQLLPQGLPCGSEVTVDLQPDTPLLEVKRQLALATGVPMRQQHVMLSGINQLVMGDKRTMKFAHCGTASSIYFAVQAGKDKA
uniref:Ubiquitin-like domain-containing protein n=1 Tax=Tetradesmus obliquus TaxID=3088 RepID=A0A383VZG5_TETOB|eukprot:jgi/Sobl393_1/4748/SZX70320.1